MGQINIRVDADIDEIIGYLADKRGIPKAVIAREILVENLTRKYIDILMNDYKEGKIGLKRLIKLSKLPFPEVLKMIASIGIEPPIPVEVDDYTKRIADKVIENMKS
ncbi:MAG TPA: hypothetical protein VKM55_14840 [Candidatus Lokiarchaeia archaeon]|nr:hypothetical protein [Candidatus Lokiarchaeia archaeon]